MNKTMKTDGAAAAERLKAGRPAVDRPVVVPDAAQPAMLPSESLEPAAGPAVGRFAPTPSGRMHIGNVYAMLAAWLSAKSRIDPETGERGHVLLRIEDVDTPRAVKDADRWIMDDLDWLELDWQGGPVYQSERSEVYEQALQSLASLQLQDVEDRADVSGTSDSSVGLAGSDRSGDVPLVYPCFCSRADIRAASAPQEGDRFLVYPGTCRTLLVEHPDEVQRRLDSGDRHSLRIAVPQREAGDAVAVIHFDDRVFGPQRFGLAHEVGDTVIRRSDGLFSYQLAVVIDDLLMGVNDVVRGRDLLRSTALQIWIRQALLASGFSSDVVAFCASQSRDVQGRGSGIAGSHSSQSPAYAHLPLIDDSAGVRLAKRRNSLDLGELRAAGARPEQVIGYCAWMLGVRVDGARQTLPVAMSAAEVLEAFSWDGVRHDRADRLLSDDLATEILGIR